jgi:hypothetical protein
MGKEKALLPKMVILSPFLGQEFERNAQLFFTSKQDEKKEMAKQRHRLCVLSCYRIP